MPSPDAINGRSKCGDLRVLALRLEGIADRIAAVPVQVEDAEAVRQAARIVRDAAPWPKSVKIFATGGD
jgi:hypothetical protein